MIYRHFHLSIISLVEQIRQLCEALRTHFGDLLIKEGSAADTNIVWFIEMLLN